jgi:hypothetical protein
MSFRGDDVQVPAFKFKQRPIRAPRNGAISFDKPHAHHRRERHVFLVPENAHFRVHVAATQHVKLDVLKPDLNKRTTSTVRSPLNVKHLGFAAPGVRQQLPGRGVPDADGVVVVLPHRQQSIPVRRCKSQMPHDVRVKPGQFLFDGH